MAAILQEMWAISKNNAPIEKLVTYALLLAALFIRPAAAQESTYIVTYDHYLEETARARLR
jgi:hypothetical protein